MRRQLSGVVKYCLPSSCWPANTSHRRNSAFSRPSPCLVMRPVTSACALMTRQSAKRGTASELVIFSVKACGLIGANSPLRWRLLAMICGDVVRGVGFGRRAGQKIGQRDRHRLHVALGHVEPHDRARRARPASVVERAGAGAGQQAAAVRPAIYMSKHGRAQISRAYCRKHLFGVEGHFDFLPGLVVLGTQHGEGLADRALHARRCRASH